MKLSDRSIISLYEYLRNSKPDMARHCKQMRRIKTSRMLLRQYGVKLGKRIKRLLPKNSVDVIIPVPLHAIKEKERGFNQAVIIAEQIGKVLDVPIYDGTVKKIKKTRELKSMPFPARKKEIKDSFRVKRKKDVSGRSILIVDDVIASGSTVNLLTDDLVKCGAKKVSAASIYRITS